MNKKLKDVLSKLLSAREAGVLSDEDYGILEDAVGKRAGAEGADAPRSMWLHIREQAFRWRQVLELQLDGWYDQMNAILLDAGVPKDVPLDTELSRKAPDVSRERLLASVRKHLTAEDMTVRQYASSLIGLAHLNELVPLVKESLATDREARNWGQYVMGAQLESLAMLELEGADEIALRYVKHDDDRIRRAAQVMTLLAAGKKTDQELAFALEGRIANPVLLGFPDEMVRAAKGGLDLDERLRAVMNSVWRQHDFRAIAYMAKNAHLEEVFKELVENGNNEMRMAAAVVAANDKHADWILPLLKAQLDQESDDQAAACIVVAIASLEKDAQSFIRTQLATAAVGTRCGAMLAAMAHGTTFAEDIATARQDSDDTIKKFAAGAALVATNDRSPELIDIRWQDLARHWCTGIFQASLVALDTAGVARPDSAVDFTYAMDKQWSHTKASVAEAREFYAARPSRLARRLHADVTSNETVRIRLHWLAGLVGGEALENALEMTFDGARSWSELNELYLECRAHGGPRSDVGRVQGMILASKQDRVLDLAEADLLPAVVVTLGTDSMVSSKGVLSLARFGERAEPYLRVFACFTDQTFAKATANAIGQLPSPSDPLLSEMAQIMTGATHRVLDLANLDVLVGSPAAAMRAKVAEIAGLPENQADEVKRHLIQLAADDVDEVVVAAVSSLASRAGGEAWVQALLLDKSRSESWTVSRQVVDMMARSPQTVYMPRLLEILAKASTDNDQDLVNRTVKALEAIAEKNPQHGMIVLDIREPRRVNERYGMNEDINWSADQRAEALRLLLVALDKRKDEAQAKSGRGKKLLLSKAKTGVPDQGGRQLSGAEFDALALYLKVSFADDESGSIVAEVGEEATGEILNALLQTDSVVVTAVAWS